MPEKSLVMGGAGFIGSHLVEALLREGHEVTVFDKTGIDQSNLEGVAGDITVIEGDFLDGNILKELPQGMDNVFHLISTTLPATSNKSPVYDVASNLEPSVKLIESCVKAKIKKFYFISSGGTVYGVPEQIPIPESHPTNPINSYAITKLSVEKYLHLYHHLHGLDYVILRVANPFGPRQPYDKPQGIIAVWMYKILQGLPVEVWGDGKQLRDYIYIDDTVSAFMSLVKAEKSSRIYNFGSGEGTSVLDIIDSLKDVVDGDFEVQFKDAVPSDVPANVLDISLAQSELGWKPKTDFREGMKQTWDWFKTNLG